MTYVARVINLIRPESQRLWSMTEAEGKQRVLDSEKAGCDPVLGSDGSFALVAQQGERVLLARSLDRPLRYFLSKAREGPVLIVAERIDELAQELARHG